MSCALCYRDDAPYLVEVPGVGDMCEYCAEWTFYWRSLSPTQQAAELQAMDDYADAMNEAFDRRAL